ncbi:hypothetical protein ACOME3_007204 [Neoechinorhynchus agilis]
MFNTLKPSRAFQYLSDQKIIEPTPIEIAKFLHAYHHRLKKSAIGDLLGDDGRLSKEIMSAYIDQMDFAGLEFLSAIRKFLSGFRLPGEAQKIDRLVEKFAARYCECNPTNEHFTSADAAYVLAYSIIMLTTDLHSPQVKKKISKEQYIAMNRSINESQHMSEEFLSKIYDEIAAEEIKLPFDSVGRSGTRKGHTDEKSRKVLFNLEMEQVQKIARSLMVAAGACGQDSSSFMTAFHAEHIGHMFKIVWYPSLAAFSIGLQDSGDDDYVTRLSLLGISCAIRIASMFRLTTELNAFIQALCRFTLLNSFSPLTDIKAKNVKCIKALISVADLNGNYLGKSWLEILRCISQLDVAQLIATFNGGGSSASSLVNVLNIRRSRLDPKKLFSFQESVMEANAQSVVVAIDRVFTGSIYFDGDAIVEFVRALCIVSAEELALDPPRTYSLQKIIEISYYNMDRVRLQWARIWELVSDHFNQVGTSSNVSVAVFAVDSLRQLALKFLEKEEFTNFHFQKEFLRPFEYVIKRTQSSAVRDMVMRCVMQLSSAEAKNLKSGWRNILGVMRASIALSSPRTGSEATVETLADLAFQALMTIAAGVVPKLFMNLLDSLHDYVKCLSEFVTFSIDAIDALVDVAHHVSQNSHLFRILPEEPSVQRDDRIWFRGFSPVIIELAAAVQRSVSNEIRQRIIDALFDILNLHGSLFKDHWWQEAISVVIRILDKCPQANQDEINQFLSLTCPYVLKACVDLQCSRHYEALRPFFIFRIYRICTYLLQKHENRSLTQSICETIQKVINHCGVDFDEGQWTLTTECLTGLLDAVFAHRNAEQRLVVVSAIRSVFIDNELALAEDAAVTSLVNECLSSGSIDRCSLEETMSYLKPAFGAVNDRNKSLESTGGKRVCGKTRNSIRWDISKKENLDIELFV